MLTACTSSEEENTPYLRKSGHNIKNNDESRKLSEDTTDYHVSDYLVVRTSSPGPDFVNSSPPPHPPNWSFNPLKKLFLSQC